MAVVEAVIDSPQCVKPSVAERFGDIHLRLDDLDRRSALGRGGLAVGCRYDRARGIGDQRIEDAVDAIEMAVQELGIGEEVHLMRPYKAAHASALLILFSEQVLPQRE